MIDSVNKTQVAIFGGGCFWCSEAVFENLRGVISVSSGYAGGNPTPDGKNPTYEQVSSGTTGHAEVIKIGFDPSEITYQNLLTVFFATHDPTTPNRQGNDIGSQYRSIILYTDPNQKQQAEEFIKNLNQTEPEGKLIITEVKPLDKFYPAEVYHQDYYRNNSSQPYCQLVINPKLEKLQKQFSDLLRSHSRE